MFDFSKPAYVTGLVRSLREVYEEHPSLARVIFEAAWPACEEGDARKVLRADENVPLAVTITAHVTGKEQLARALTDFAKGLEDGTIAPKPGRPDSVFDVLSPVGTVEVGEAEYEEASLAVEARNSMQAAVRAATPEAREAASRLAAEMYVTEQDRIRRSKHE